jgi:hypothetical protein
VLLTTAILVLDLSSTSLQILNNETRTVPGNLWSWTKTCMPYVSSQAATCAEAIASCPILRVAVSRESNHQQSYINDMSDYHYSWTSFQNQHPHNAPNHS